LSTRGHAHSPRKTGPKGVLVARSPHNTNLRLAFRARVSVMFNFGSGDQAQAIGDESKPILRECALHAVTSAQPGKHFRVGREVVARGAECPTPDQRMPRGP